MTSAADGPPWSGWIPWTTRRWVDSSTGWSTGLPPGTRSALVDRAEGIPLFAVETIRSLIDRDAVIPSGGRYVPADGVEVDLDAIGAPASLQALIAARLDALTPAERRVVTDASVLGAAFTRTGLASLGTDDAELDAVLDSLVRKEIIALTTDRFSAEVGQYRFVQAMVRQVAYGTQSRRDRKQRHLAAADYLASEPDAADLAVVIAQHLLDAIDSSGATDPDRDGTDAAGPHAPGGRCGARTDTRVAPRGAATPGDGPGPDEAHRPAALARSTTTRPQAALDAGDYTALPITRSTATDLFDQLGRPTDAGRAAATHALAVDRWATTPAAIAIAKPRWEALRSSPDADAAVLELAGCLAFAHAGLGQYDADAAPYIDRAVLIAEAIERPAALSRVLRQMATLHSARGAPITALRAQPCAPPTSPRDLGLQDALSGALTIQVSIQFSRDLDAAMVNSREGVEAARRGGVTSSHRHRRDEPPARALGRGTSTEAPGAALLIHGDASQVHPIARHLPVGRRCPGPRSGRPDSRRWRRRLATTSTPLAWWGHAQMVRGARSR